MGRIVELNAIPIRIVSLVPSQTELLVDLGLADKIVGVTKFCVHPSGIRRTAKTIGGTKTLNIDAIKALNPDLIIGNKEENERSQIEELEKHFPVWISDISTLEDSLEMIRRLGKLCGAEETANGIAGKIAEQFQHLHPLQSSQKAVYLIWKNPFLAAGSETFIADMLKRCGFENCVTDSRYPEVNLDKLSPRVVLLSNEPYPFSEKHIDEIAAIFPDAKVLLVDGEFFSWYGSRLTQAPAYFQSIVDCLQAD